MPSSQPNLADVVFVQKRAGLTLRFEFHDDRLTQVLTTKSGTKTVRDYDFADIPDQIHFRSHAAKRGFFLSLGTFLLLLLVQFAIHPDMSLFLAGIGAVVVALFWAAYRLFGGRIEKRRTEVPASDGPIVILQDRRHDEIVAEILNRRQTRLRAYAAIDPAQTKRQNLVRLRALAEMRATSEAEYFELQRQLLPEVSQTFLRGGKDAEPEVVFEQKRFDVRCRFQFGERYLRYARSDLMGSNSITIDYSSLPRLDRLDEAPVASGVVRVAMILAVLGVVGAGLALLSDGSGLPTYGWQGALASAAVVIPLVVVMALLLSPRWSRLRATRIWQGVVILQDAGHAAILDELTRRHAKMIQALAEVDPLLTLAAQRSRLSWLVSTGALSEADALERMAQAELVQSTLTLDVLPDGTALEDLTEGPAQVVLH